VLSHWGKCASKSRTRFFLSILAMLFLFIKLAFYFLELRMRYPHWIVFLGTITLEIIVVSAYTFFCGQRLAMLHGVVMILEAGLDAEEGCTCVLTIG